MDSDSSGNFVLKEIVTEKKRKKNKNKNKYSLVGYFLILLINLDRCRVHSFPAKSLWGVKANKNATALSAR